jgi:hypothetical protein
MKKNINFSFLLILTILLHACSKELDITIPYDGDKLFIYGNIEHKKPLSIGVGRTVSPIGTSDIPNEITNAIVKLWEDDTIFVSQLTYKGNGIYKTDYLADSTHTYHITVTAEGYPDAKSGRVKIPTAPIISHSPFYIDYNCTFNESPCLHTLFTITDPANSKDYYGFQVVENYTDKQQSGYAQIYPHNFVCPEIENNPNFSDLCFNGKSIQLKIKAPSNRTSENFTGYLFQFFKLDENLAKLSAVPYRYDGFFQIFTPAANTPSNIEGGYGMFGAVSRYTTVWQK